MASMKRYRLAKHRKGQDPTQNTLDRRKYIRLGCLNTDGWGMQKEFDIQAAIESKNIDVFSVIETHLRKGDKEKLLLKGFTVFETRRSEGAKKGGGIAVFARKTNGVVYKKHSPAIKKQEHTVERAGGHNGWPMAFGSLLSGTKWLRSYVCKPI